MLLESEIRLFLKNLVSRCSVSGFCKVDGILFKTNGNILENVTMVYEETEVRVLDLLELKFKNNIYDDMYNILAYIIKSRITYIEG